MFIGKIYLSTNMKQKYYFSLFIFGLAFSLMLYVFFILPLSYHLITYKVFIFSNQRLLLYLLPLIASFITLFIGYKQQKKGFYIQLFFISIGYIVLSLSIIIWTIVNYNSIVLNDVCVNELELQFNKNYPSCMIQKQMK